MGNSQSSLGHYYSLISPIKEGLDYPDPNSLKGAGTGNHTRAVGASSNGVPFHFTEREKQEHLGSGGWGVNSGGSFPTARKHFGTPGLARGTTSLQGHIGPKLNPQFLLGNPPGIGGHIWHALTFSSHWFTQDGIFLSPSGLLCALRIYPRTFQFRGVRHFITGLASGGPTFFRVRGPRFLGVPTNGPSARLGAPVPTWARAHATSLAPPHLGGAPPDIEFPLFRAARPSPSGFARALAVPPDFGRPTLEAASQQGFAAIVRAPGHSILRPAAALATSLPPSTWGHF